MYFENTSKVVFSFWVTLLNGIVVNILKIMGPTDKTTHTFSSLSLSLSLSRTHIASRSSSSFRISFIVIFAALMFTAMLVFFFLIKQNLFEFNSHQKNKTHRNNMPNPKKQNPFEFKPHRQNTNQIKHLEQTKERNSKREAKMLGPRLRGTKSIERDEEKRILGFLWKEKKEKVKR